MTGATVVALLGAESTGKTTLARELVDALRADGLDAAAVAEHLRTFCDTHARTPRQHEQQGIAEVQTRRIEAARSEHHIVIADTTALQIAVYSDLVFGDQTLYASAQAWQRGVDLSLLSALDLPWQADGLQRDGPHVRVRVDAALRAALQRAQVAYGVVSGSGPARLACALAAVRHLLRRNTASRDEGVHWRAACERCGEPQCERHLLPQFTARDPGG